MNINTIRKNPSRKLMQFAIPSVIGMLLTSLIPIVDGIFIGQNVGKDGLAAVNLGIPVLYLFLGVAIMVSVGGSTIAIQKLGSKEKSTANNIFNQTMVTIVCAVLLVSLLSKILLNPLQNILNIVDPVRSYINEYYGIMLIAYPVMMLNIAFGMFIRGEGRPDVFMKINILTNIVNVVLDAIFIVNYNLGVRGAAYASAISVILGLVVITLYFARKKSKFRLGSFRFSPQDFRNTLLNGSSELIGQLSMSVTTGLLNLVILNVIGVIGVAAMTIVGYVGYIYNMIIIGIGQGMSPIISYSFGAKDLELMVRIRKNSQKVVFACGGVFFIIMSLVGSIYAGLFSDNINLQMLVVRGLSIYAFGFLVAGYNIIASFFFTSIGQAKQSAIISSMRGLVILSINILLLPFLFKETGIWLVFPLTELITFIISVALIKGLDLKTVLS